MSNEKQGAAPRAMGPRPENCECGHKWHGDAPCPWIGTENGMGLVCDCQMAYAVFSDKDFCVPATGARESAYRIVRFLQELHEMRQEPKIVEKLPGLAGFFEQIICDNFAACQSAAPAPKCPKCGSVDISVDFTALCNPCQYVRRGGSEVMAEFFPAHAGGERGAPPDGWTLEQTLINVSRLLDGWHQDGTAWSEWDEKVRVNVSNWLALIHAKEQL